MDNLLSWHMLNIKLVSLLALTNFKRASDLHKLDTRFCSTSDKFVTFHIMEKPKQHRKKGTLPPPTTFKASMDGLCPVKTLKFYMEMTKPYRISEGHHKLFLSHLNPHKSVTNDTIRRWLKTALKRCGVNTADFQGHSIRAASSSYAKSKGASISEIMNLGGWSNQSTWQKHYHFEIL